MELKTKLKNKPWKLKWFFLDEKLLLSYAYPFKQVYSAWLLYSKHFGCTLQLPSGVCQTNISRIYNQTRSSIHGGRLFSLCFPCLLMSFFFIAYLLFCVTCLFILLKQSIWHLNYQNLSTELMTAKKPDMFQPIF